ncbi:hypothetical protein [Isoptericola rhizosphaerae]|uniref:hypothetical protein n=1 Tax=Isoptericola rhizosphaerae TaxID=3377837 RepID=UPI00383B24E6
MPHENASAPKRADAPDEVSSGEDLLAAYLEYLAATGRRSAHFKSAARRFFRTWSDPQDWAAQPVEERLAADKDTRPLLTYLMLHRRLQPGYDYLLERHLSPLWREIGNSPLGPEINRFLDGAQMLGLAAQTRLATGSQVPARLLIQTGRRLDDLTVDDLEDFADACRARGRRNGKNQDHYLVAINITGRVLYHLGVLTDLPRKPHRPAMSPEERLASVAVPLRAELVAYLRRKRATCTQHTVDGITTKLNQFGTFLTEIDPDLRTIRDLDRQRHIEPWLASLVDTARMRDGEPITPGTAIAAS